MSEHVVSPKVYVAVFVALLVLTGVTVAAARQDFGALNAVIALAIAAIKASLVVLFFMHVKYSPRLVWLVVAGSVFCLLLLIGGTLHDYVSRGWLGAPHM